MFFLERTDFATHTHTFCQHLDDAIVALVDLGTELAQVFGGVLVLADD